MGEFKTVSLADQVFERLEDDIITGKYPRGELMTELKLAEQLGVSRTPIREALRRLEQENLIRDSGKGSVVLGITQEDLVDIMDIRQRLEGFAAACAVERMTPEGMEELSRINALQDFYYSKRDAEQLQKMDDSFHDTIYDLCGRTVLRDTLRVLHKKTQRYRRISIGDPDRMEHSVEEHRAIFQAIAAGDARLAEEVTCRHIKNAKENMIGRLK